MMDTELMAKPYPSDLKSPESSLWQDLECALLKSFISGWNG